MSAELALSLTLKLRPRLRRGKERTEDITEPQTIFHGYNQSEFHRFHTCMGLTRTMSFSFKFGEVLVHFEREMRRPM